MTFHVGQKVVCVNDTDTELVVKGRVYVVEGVGPCPRVSAGHIVVNGVRGLTGFHGMMATRFRPIVERETSIEIFTAMLKPSKVEA